MRLIRGPPGAYESQSFDEKDSGMTSVKSRVELGGRGEKEWEKPTSEKTLKPLASEIKDLIPQQHKKGGRGKGRRVC